MSAPLVHSEKNVPFYNDSQQQFNQMDIFNLIIFDFITNIKLINHN